MVTPGARREAVVHACEVHGVSQRRACAVLAVDRSSVRYRSCRASDAGLRSAMKQIAAERRRFGYRRIHILLAREGWKVNHKKLRRLYREERLQVRRRGGRKRALGTRRPMVDASGYWLWWMITHANVWRWWLTPHCPECDSYANSMH